MKKKSEAVTLEDIIPMKPEFFLAAKNKTYSVRPPNLSDRVWIRETFGSEEAMREMIGNQDFEQICRLVYRLMASEDRADFLAQQVDIVNEEGDKLTKRFTGPQVLFVSLAGLEEGVKVIGALGRAIMLSNPLIAKAVEEEVKKNLSAIQASPKSPSRPSIGRKFSIHSKANTAGQKKR